MTRGAPPVFARWFLDLVVPTSCKEAVVGDLIEEYALRAESASSFAASRWFWSQACRSVMPLLWTLIRKEWLTGLRSAVGVYMAMAALKFVAELTISRLITPGPATRVTLAPVVFLTAAAVGGCIAARMRPGATIFLAFMVMITVAVLIAVNVCTVPVPWWYQLGFLMLGPLFVVVAPALLDVLRGSSRRPTSPGRSVST